jgi:transposase
MADEFGVHPEALRNWIRKAEARPAPVGERGGENPEVVRLRKEVEDLRRANEILKAANAFLAQQVDASSLRT